MIKKWVASIVRVMSKINQIISVISLVVLIFTILLIVSDVFLRYFFNSPILGSVEIVQYAMVVIGFLGLAWCAIKDGHLKVDFIVNRLSAKIQSITDSITMFLSITVMPLIAWQGFVQARWSYLHREVSNTLGIPEYPFYLIVGIGFSLLFFVMLTFLFEAILRILDK